VGGTKVGTDAVGMMVAYVRASCGGQSRLMLKTLIRLDKLTGRGANLRNTVPPEPT
jgi:hypothetical protein